MHVGIIGGGMMGLATAFYLNKKGVQVTILEIRKEIGGLSGSIEILPGIRWDRFYHVILSTDKVLLEFLDEIGLSLDAYWRETKTGFYTDGQLHSLSSTAEFLKFKPLSFVDKLRLGIGILYSSKINNWRRLEKVYVKTWLVRVFGRRIYEKMWEPLLRSKFGSAKDQASAALIWAIIKRYYGTRHTSSKKELMGCVRGGYYSLLNHLNSCLSRYGTRIITNCDAEKVRVKKNTCIGVQTRSGEPLDFDRVIATVPNQTIVRLVPDISPNFKSKLEAVNYLSIVCVTLVLKRSLTPFYVTNLTDNGLPFTGLIEATNVIPKENLEGNSLVYLPKYLPLGDPYYKKPDHEILENFLKSLKRMFPDLLDKDIVSYTVNREPYVQPVQDIDYSQKISSIETPLKNFYMVNTTMILNSTLNNNEVIKLARKTADLVTR